MVKLQNPSGVVLEVAEFSVEYLKSKGWTEPKPVAKPAAKKKGATRGRNSKNTD